MGQEHIETRSPAKNPPSYIPVITPRPSLSCLPSSLSTPNLGLVPPSRLPVVSASPAPSTGHNTPSPGAAGGFAQFRSFRNLLSFGSSKNHTALSSNGSRPSFGLRRSSTAEYIAANPAGREKSEEDIPVVSIEKSHTIELTHRVDEPLIDSDELQKRLGLRPPTPETVSPALSIATTVNSVDVPGKPAPMLYLRPSLTSF